MNNAWPNSWNVRWAVLVEGTVKYNGSVSEIPVNWAFQITKCCI